MSSYGGNPTAKLDEVLKSALRQVEEAERTIPLYRQPFEAWTCSLSSDEFAFLVQDLCNKGLLIDYNMKHGCDPHTIVEITPEAINLIVFLKE